MVPAPLFLKSFWWRRFVKSTLGWLRRATIEKYRTDGVI
jgi:hypothetical protein